MKRRQISKKALEEVRRALAEYENEVRDAGLAPTTERTYLRHAGTFVRWLEGDFEPGQRV